MAQDLAHSIYNIPPSRWKCTAAKAAVHSLPRKLEHAALALNLPIQKDMDGNRLIKKHMKPRPQWKKWNETGRVGPEPLKWNDNVFERWAIYDYCVTDTDVERLLDNTLDDISPLEQKLWVINQKVNFKGITIDIEAVKKIIGYIKAEEKRLTKDLQRITKGKIESAGQTKKLVEWARKHKCKLPNMQAATVKQFIESDDTPDVVKKVLTIRSQVSKTSNKKYFSFVDRTDTDNCAKDILLFSGANTGRDSGVGIQIHNFPRGSHKNTDEIIDDILNESIELIRFVYGDLFTVFSSCLRGMIIASVGHELFRADYNAIECRVLNWLADNKAVIDDFKNGVDQYKKMASKVFGIKVSEVDGGKKDGPQRFLGKTIVLACGYGMGWKKFLKQCESYGIKDITEDLAQRAVQIYRETNYLIPQMWYNVERAAIMAVQKPGRVVSVHKVKYYVKDNFLWCVLPSGRKLAYHRPSLRKKKTPWGEMKLSLHYWAVDSQTRKYTRVHTYGGSLVENICQAVSADILKNGQMNLIRARFSYLFNVHDELVGEAPKGKKTVDEFITCLTTLPKWADGLPVKAEGWKGPRFRK